MDDFKKMNGTLNAIEAPKKLWCYFRCNDCDFRFRVSAVFSEGQFQYESGQETVPEAEWNERNLNFRMPPWDMPEGHERSFFSSWDVVESFMSRGGFYCDFEPLCDLIEEMRGKGYDRTLRAGSSLSVLVLSRSREWGSYTNSLEFHLTDADRVDVKANLAGEQQQLREPCKLTPAIDAFLRRLQALPLE
jgi:hypothetical protein